MKSQSSPNTGMEVHWSVTRVWLPKFILPTLPPSFDLPKHSVLTSHFEAYWLICGKAVDMERRLLPVELEDIRADEFPKEGVGIIETEEEASETRMMQLHLGGTRDSLTLMPKLSCRRWGAITRALRLPSLH